MVVTAGVVLRLAAELDVRPSVIVDVLYRVIEECAGAYAKGFGDLEQR